MLIQIPYTGIHGDTVVINLNPDQIMCAELLVSNGRPSLDLHIWMVDAPQPMLLVGAGLPVVVGTIDNYYRSIGKYCPFMYITNSVFMNVNYVQFVDRAIIEGKYDYKTTSVFMTGSTLRIQVPGRTVDEVVNDINTVMKHVKEDAT